MHRSLASLHRFLVVPAAGRERIPLRFNIDIFTSFCDRRFYLRFPAKYTPPIGRQVRNMCGYLLKPGIAGGYKAKTASQDDYLFEDWLGERKI